MKNLNFTVLFAFILLVFTGCDTNIELDNQEGKIIEIIAPVRARLGQTIVAEVVFEGKNGCSRPDKATYGQEKNVYLTKTFYTHPKDTKVQCTQDVPIFREQIYIEMKDTGSIFIRSFSNKEIFAEVIVEME